jgi:hypothetical protein
MSESYDRIREDDEPQDDLDEDEATKRKSDPTDDDLGLEKRKIFTDKSDPHIGGLYQLYQAGDLVFQPLFQRRQVWVDLKSSKLIESVILRVPLPVFYFAEGTDDKQEVIDGQQRLTAFFHFLENAYPLKGLKALRHLNGASASERLPVEGTGSSVLPPFSTSWKTLVAIHYS